MEKTELKTDLIRCYPILREIALVPYTLLKLVCSSEIAVGKTDDAKTKMTQLCALNPYDGDYLLAALDVAVESKDHTWIEEILATIEKLKTEHPWYLTLSAFETEDPASSQS